MDKERVNSKSTWGIPTRGYSRVRSLLCFTVTVYCDRLGVDVEEEIRPPDSMPNEWTDMTTWREIRKEVERMAEEQHSGQCGNRNDPCLSKAISITGGK
jgi:hypothetical protein